MFFFIKLSKIIAKIIYLFLKLLPTKNKIVMISRRNSITSIDFKLLKDEINKTSPTTRVVILNHKLVNKQYIIIQVLVEMYHLATSKGCIVDSYVIPVSILKHKKKLIIIQIWHALGAIKKFGYAALNSEEGVPSNLASLLKMHKNYTYVISGSEEMVPYFSLCYNIDESKIKPYSMPRVDYLIRSNKDLIKNKIFDTYKSLENKKIILYAPTFRKGKKVPINKLIKEIDFTKYSLIYKQHPLDKTKMKKNTFDGVFVDEQFDIIDLLNLSNYVITDYSAVAFEAAVLEKPLFFYTYDINNYKKNRGLFIDYESNIMPGIVSNSPKEIIKSIEKNNYSIDKIRKFKEKYISVLDGSSSKQIINLLELE